MPTFYLMPAGYQKLPFVDTDPGEADGISLPVRRLQPVSFAHRASQRCCATTKPQKEPQKSPMILFQ